MASNLEIASQAQEEMVGGILMDMIKSFISTDRMARIDQEKLNHHFKVLKYHICKPKSTPKLNKAIWRTYDYIFLFRFIIYPFLHKFKFDKPMPNSIKDNINDIYNIIELFCVKITQSILTLPVALKNQQHIAFFIDLEKI